MRRSAALILALMLAFGILPAGAAEPRGRVDEQAVASWILRTDRPHHFRWLALVVIVQQEAGGPRRAFAVPIRGRCRTASGSLTCGGGGRISRLSTGSFEMTADLSSASLDFKQDGNAYRAAIAGEGLGPGPYFAGEACAGADGEEGEGYGAGLMRGASASGSFAGRKMKPAPEEFEFSYLARGAMVTECDGWGPQIVSRSADRVRVRWTPAAALLSGR